MTLLSAANDADVAKLPPLRILNSYFSNLPNGVMFRGASIRMDALLPDCIYGKGFILYSCYFAAIKRRSRDSFSEVAHYRCRKHTL